MPRPDGTPYQSELFASTVDGVKSFGTPILIGGTRVTEERVIGPPSRMLPALRDLGTGTIALNEQVGGPVRPVITIEIDTPKARRVGVIHSLSNRPGADEVMYIEMAGTSGSSAKRTPIKLKDILAFRVLKVEAPRAQVRAAS